jgi:hypothetical protein
MCLNLRTVCAQIHHTLASPTQNGVLELMGGPPSYQRWERELDPTPRHHGAQNGTVRLWATGVFGGSWWRLQLCEQPFPHTPPWCQAGIELRGW